MCWPHYGSQGIVLLCLARFWGWSTTPLQMQIVAILEASFSCVNIGFLTELCYYLVPKLFYEISFQNTLRVTYIHVTGG